MLSLNFLSDALIAVAFVVIPVSFIIAIKRQKRLRKQFKIASAIYAVSMLTVAFSIVVPHIWPALNGTVYEFAVKLTSFLFVLAASFVSWPFLRSAMQRSKLLTPFTDPELLVMERDDLAAANTDLEKKIVQSSYNFERINRQMRLALIGSPITLFRQDKDLRYTWVFNAPANTKESDLIGRSDNEIFPPEAALAIAEIKKLAMDEEKEESAEVPVNLPNGNFWYFLRTQPDYDKDGHIIGTISCAIDITEQKRQQQRLVGLMREVTHRSKNLLAVLQSIARQTASRTQNIDEFLSRFTARLQSIARSHDLLVNDDWSGTFLKKLLQSQLALFSDVEPGRIRTKGDDMLLTSVAVQNLGLAFHELLANASNFGSLSQPSGVVDVSWWLASADNSSSGEKYLYFVWKEDGGPAIVTNNERGFGRLLLEGVVGQALGGKVEMNFSTAGLVCTMRLPVSRVTAAKQSPDALSDQGTLAPA